MSVRDAVHAHLEAAGVVDTVVGALALALADAIDRGATDGLPECGRLLREYLVELTGAVPPAVVDEIRRKREERLGDLGWGGAT